MSHLSKLQSAMKAAHTEAIVVSSEINQRYLSGLHYTDGFVVVLPEKAFLLADFRYIEDARTQVDSREFEIVMPDRLHAGLCGRHPEGLRRKSGSF